MELTADEKDMLALTARNPDPEAWRDHYRHLQLPCHESTDKAVGTRIRKLRERPDARLFLDQQQLELERNRIDAMKASDGAGWKVEEARQELAEATYKLASAAVNHELGRIEAAEEDDTGKKRASAPNMTAKLIEIAERLSARSAEGAQRTPEERAMLAKQLGIVQGEGIVVPVKAGPPQPPKQEAKA